MSPRKRRNKRALCAYCGIRLAITDDHVIPRCLYQKPFPLNMIKVPSCEQCNQDKARDEDYLRDMLVADIATHNHPIAHSLFDGAMSRSIQSNRSQLIRSAMTQTRWVPMRTPAGLYLGRYPVMPLEEKRVNQIFARIIRGLHYKNIHRRIPSNYVFDIRRLQLKEAEELFHMLRQLGQLNGPFQQDVQVFQYAFLFADKDPGISCWLLEFYNGIFIAVFTEPSQTNTQL